MKRRDFLRLTAGTAVAAALADRVESKTVLGSQPTAASLPRWRGFNLLEKFWLDQNHPFAEWDFNFMATWGFDFARLPMSYLCWTQPGHWREFREPVLKEIDQAVEWGRQYGVHICLNFHRAPGYCVAAPAEPKSLWTDPDAQAVCALHWATFARRYKGIPNTRLSFNLPNEPAEMCADDYARVVRILAAAIRAEDAQRLIICDGTSWGGTPVPELIPLRVAQSTRGYAPMGLSHYKANWMPGSDRWREPKWPLVDDDGGLWNSDRLWREQIMPWKVLQTAGSGIHVGEWGAYNQTPHKVTLAWMRDCLQNWKSAGWGWTLWNLRGAFGLLDSQRRDVTFENYDGHKLDRAMLELLLAS